MVKAVFGKNNGPDNKSNKPLVASKGGAALSRHVANAEFKMGIWDQFKFNKKSSELAREELGEIAIAMVTKQRDEIIQKLTLDLDVNKKAAFSEYMNKVGFLNVDLVESSSEMERTLRGLLRNEISKIYVEKGHWVKQIEDLGLSDSDRTEEMERMKEWITNAKGQIDGKITLLCQKHTETMEQTMKLLRDEAFSGSSAMNLE